VGQIVKGTPCAVNVTLTPTINGPDNDVVQITDNAASGTQSVHVTGRGAGN
jgi:hypothetical protein